MARHTMGWLGWFSLAGFIILGALYLIDLNATGVWPVSTTWTGIIALIAGIGALALYFGNDPTARVPQETTTEREARP